MSARSRRSSSSSEAPTTNDARELGSLIQILVVCGDDAWLSDLTRLVRHRVSLVAPDNRCPDDE